MDPLSPKPPQGAYFDLGLRAWILSRHADVFAALRETALRQERGKQPHTRAQTLSALPLSNLADWQAAMEFLARQIVAGVPGNRPVDLVREVLAPWTQELAIQTLREGSARKARLRAILRARTASSGRFHLGSKLARARFELFFRKRPGDKSAFIGISETLPAFLANAWAALLRHPAELARLRAHPELMPGAIEELLRYAGLVHSLVRHAASDVDLAGVRIAGGDRVILKLASANRDPERFANPDCLDLSRRSAGHCALGHGEHSCVGAMLLRLASAAITRAFVERFANAEIAGEIEWRWGNTLVSPATLPARPISQ
jgi:cytochrome P450